MTTRPILITGCNGQVGFELQRALAPLGPLLALDRQACDLADLAGLGQLVRQVRPRVIVNAAAYTAVDRAEGDQDLAGRINGQAPGVLGEAALAVGAAVVHYSTDYVFDGRATQPYRESDPTHPLSVYGATKLAGEQALQQSGAPCLILRTSWVFGAHGGNFARTMLRLGAERESLNVVADQWGAPTSAALIADVTAQLLGRHLQNPAAPFPWGLYHLAAAGETCWHDYAAHVFAAARRAGYPLRLAADGLRPIPASDYPVPAPRPASSRLDTALLRQTFGLHLPPWQQGLDHVLQQIL